MVNLTVRKNIVFLKRTEPCAEEFINRWLVKFEETTTIDPFQSSKKKKKLQTIKVKRNLFTENGDYISFARGILDWIPTTEYILNDISNDSLVIPNPTSDEILKSIPSFDLRDDQIIAVNKCLHCKRGVIQLPTAVGKSAIIASTIKWLLKFNPQMKTLVLAPTLSTVEGINSTFVKNDLPSSVFRDASQEIRPITTSLVQTLSAFDYPPFLEDIQAVFYDECLPGKSKILLPDGSYESIEQIFYDDSIFCIMSYNTELGIYESKSIVRKIQQPFNDRFCRVYYLDQIKEKVRGITCTPNHKIFTKNRGYVPAEELVQGDLIKIDYPNLRYSSFSSELYMPITRVVFNRGRIAKYKYNLEIEGNHNYFADDVLVSNCHHLKCDTWNSLNAALPNVEYSLGFSALAIDKEDIHKNFDEVNYTTALIGGNSGKVLLHMDASYYIQKGIIALPIVFRLDNTINYKFPIDESVWSNVVKYGIKSEDRTDLIVNTSLFFINEKRKTLILVSEKEYGLELATKILNFNPNAKIGVSFGAGKGFLYSYKEDKLLVESKNSLDVINMLSNGEVDLLIGTSHIDEGVDISQLDILILSAGGKKNRRVIQRLGRVLRKSKTGKYAYIIDFSDQNSKVLSRQSQSRLEMYQNEIGIPYENIYSNISFTKLKEKFYELEK